MSRHRERSAAARHARLRSNGSGGRRGCERYRFAGHVVSLVATPESGGSSRARIAIQSDGAFLLRVEFVGTSSTFEVARGSQEFVVPSPAVSR